MPLYNCILGRKNKMKEKMLWKSLIFGIIILFLGASVIPSIGGIANISKNMKTENERPFGDFGSTQLFFTENAGQFNDNVLFQVRTSEATVYLCQDEVVSVFSRSTGVESEVEILSTVSSLVDTNKGVTVQGEGVLPHHHNYYNGNDPTEWHTYVPNYGAVYYKNIYQGVDLKYYSKGNSLKYDFIVSPGSDPSVIQIQYEGVEDLFLTPMGDIQIDTNFGSIFEKKPFIYQDINGVKKEISGEYKIIKPNVFGFEINDYFDSSYPLVIDPTLQYSTYFGGTAYDCGREIEVDNSGNLYITGETESPNFPTSNPYQGIHAGSSDAFVTKLHYSTNSLAYSTFLGGSNFDYGASIDIDGAGYASIVGTTYSNNFPVFAALFPSLSGVQDAFVARFDPNGVIMFCTYLGGTHWEWGLDIAVDAAGFSYVTGFTDSPGFPMANPYDSFFNSGFDIFVSKFDPPGGVLMYSTFLGGSMDDIGTAIECDSNGNAYVTGYTWSTNFPVTPATAYDSSYNGGADICLATLDTVAGGPASLLYGTYVYGTADDFPYDVAIDGSGIYYVVGETASTQNNFFPITSNAYQQFLQGIRDAFFFKLDPSLTPANQMLYCTYLGGQVGGSGHDAAQSIDLDSNNCAYIAGSTECSDFPLVNPLGPYNALNEAFASLFDPTQVGTASLLDSTYIGGSFHDEAYGIAVDSSDDAFVTGLTFSTDFPTQNPYQASNNGLGDAFVTKISPAGGVNNPPNKPATPSGPTNGKAGTSYPYTTNAVDPDSDKVRYGWDWDGDSIVDEWDDNGGSYYASGVIITTSHSWPAQGTYNVKVMAEDIHGAGSVWSDPLAVTMPRNRAIQRPVLNFLQQHPNMFPILRQILGL